MSVFIRIALGLVVITGLGAADREQFTLKDGRVIVGTYDEVSQVLAMESPKASLHVDARDIVKREDAPIPVAVPTVAVKPKDVAPEGASVVDDLRSVEAKASDLVTQSNDLKKQAITLRSSFCLHWLMTANLDPAIVPKMDADPTRSQMARDSAIAGLNQELDRLLACRKEAAEHGGELNSDGEFHIVEEFIQGDNMPLYLETRAAGMHEPRKDAPPVASPRAHKPRPIPH